jgi:hypothetical protein
MSNFMHGLEAADIRDPLPSRFQLDFSRLPRTLEEQAKVFVSKAREKLDVEGRKPHVI